MLDSQKDIADKNPGLPQFIHIQTQEILPYNFDGVKFIFNKSFNSQFAMSHVMNITNGPDNGYRFGTMFSGDKKEWKGFALPILQGEITTDGHFVATITQQFSCSRFVSEVQYGKSLVLPNLTFDWLGKNSTTSISASKVTLNKGSAQFSCSYLKTVTNNLSLGVRGSYWRLAEGVLPLPECIAKYEPGPYGWSLSFGFCGMQLHHHFRVDDNLKLAVMLNSNFNTDHTVGVLGYKYSCPKKQIVVAGAIDSQWNVMSTVEKMMSPLPIVLLLSASLNHRTNRFGLGCGLILNK